MDKWLDTRKTTQTIDSYHQSQIVLNIIKGIMMRKRKNNRFKKSYSISEPVVYSKKKYNIHYMLHISLSSKDKTNVVFLKDF